MVSFSSLNFRGCLARSCRSLLATTVLAGASAPLWAQSSWTPQAGFVQAGFGVEVQSLTAGVSWPWSRTWSLGGGQLGGYWEAWVSRWQTEENSTQRRLNQVGFTPMFRWRPARGASPWFVEAGVGLTQTSSLYQNRDKHFSTRFNFGDHIGFGRGFGTDQRHEVLLRLSHFSNASIREPNPGENFLQLRYTARFD